MTLDKRMLIGGVAAIAILGIGAGFVVARLADPHGFVETAESSEEGEEAEGEQEEGFVALEVDEATEAGVSIAKVERGGGSDLILAGRISVIANAQSAVGAPLAGTLVELQVAPGASVRRGAAIATIRSPEGALARAQLDTAQAAAEAANAADARDKTLLDQGVIARQEWEATRAAAIKAQAELRAAQASAATMGSPGPNGLAVVRSPINGIVTRTLVGPGSVVGSGAEIALISDSSRVEVVLDAPPATTGLIVVGSRIEARWTGGDAVEAEVTGVAPGSAGMDLRANISESITLAPLERSLVPTGLFMELTEGYEAQIRPRSGLAIKRGLTMLNSPGTIDSDSRGEIKCIVVNLSNEPQTIEPGERIAQMVIARYEQIVWEEVSELSDSIRGTGGFGSTS